MKLYSLGVLGGFAGLAALSALAGCSVTTNNTSGCGVDDTVSCASYATGYSCDNSDRPEDTDSTLVCSDGTDVGGDTLYCCVHVASGSTCVQDDSVSCPTYAIPFSCSGSDTPDDADTSLSCSSPTDSGTGLLLYCCAD